MLLANCHGTEIAAHFGMAAHTFYDRCFLEKGVNFSQYSQEKKSSGDILLKKRQFFRALNAENDTMLIYLGKVRLGQIEARHKEDNSEQLGQLMQLISNLAGKPIELPQEKASDESQP